MNKFYVYCYIDPRNGEPFYIGKGCGDRDKDHQLPSHLKKHTIMGNKLRKMLKERVHPGVFRIIENLTEEEALKYEIFFILALGRRKDKDNPGPLTNLTDGGEGVSGRIGTRPIQRGRKFKGTWQETLVIDGKTYPCSKRWNARITYKGKHENLGSFDTEEEAARAYDAAAIKLYEDPVLNFPEEHGRMNPPVVRKKPPVVRKKPTKSTGRCVGSYLLNGVYRAAITIDGKNLTLGYFHTDKEARRAYDEVAVHHREKRTLNFPEEWARTICQRELVVPIDMAKRRNEKKAATAKRQNEKRDKLAEIRGRRNPRFRWYLAPPPPKRYKGTLGAGPGWVTNLVVNGRNKMFGTHETEGEAARRYDQAVIELRGEGWLNFKPDVTDGYTGYWDEKSLHYDPTRA